MPFCAHSNLHAARFHTPALDGLHLALNFQDAPRVSDHAFP